MSLPAPTELLRQLVAERSISSTESALDCSNAGVIALLADWLRGLGAEVQIHNVIAAPLRKQNLIARFGPDHGSGEGGLVFSGHTDTVPFDAGRWQTDPFQLTEIDGRLHGLGTTDMKGFLAVAVAVAAGLDPSRLKKPLTIVATCDEESTMSGGRWLEEHGVLKPDWVIIGEPTDLVPVRAHKGHLAHRICAHGHSGHSSNPDAGINALDALHGVMGQLMQWREEIKAQHHDDSFAVPHPTLNFGRLVGGDAVNRICPQAELDFDFRPLPDMPLPAVYTALQAQLQSAQQNTRAQLAMSELWPGTPAFSTPASAPLVSAASALSGHAAICVNYGTEAPYFRALGAEVIVMGPGSIDRAHQPNEYVRVDELQQCEVLLKAFVEKFCY